MSLYNSTWTAPNISLLRKRIDSTLMTYPDPAFKRRAQIIISNLEADSAERVLDAGCGFGMYEILLNVLFGRLEVVAIDIDARRLRRAKSALRTDHQFICSDAANLPFRNDSFDRVIASEILEHLIDEKRALADIARVLKKGPVLLSVPHANYPFAWDPLNFLLERLTGSHIPPRSGVLAGIWYAHQRLYLEEELVRKITNSGLRVVRIWRTTSFCLPFLQFILYIIAASLERLGFRGMKTLLGATNEKRSLFLWLTYRMIDLLDKFNADDSSQKRFVNLIVRANKLSSSKGM